MPEDKDVKFELKRGVNECSNSEYHSDNNWIGSSGFKRLLKDPRGFYREYICSEEPKEVLEGKWKLVCPSPKKTSSALSLGSLVHTMILEPHLTEEEYYFFEGKARRGKAFEEALEIAESSGKTLITHNEYLTAQKMIESYQELDAAVDLIEGGLSEHTVCQELSGIKVKARADRINIDKGFIVDIKTTSDPTDAYSFKETCKKYDYMLSAALYKKVFDKEYGKNFVFYFLVLGKSTKLCDVYKVSSESMSKALSRLNQAFVEYHTRMENNSWDEYTIQEI